MSHLQFWAAVGVLIFLALVLIADSGDRWP